MKPYYQDEWVTIIHADCRDVLPRLPRCSVDLILTDPPYGVKWEGRKRSAGGEFGPIRNDDGSLDILSILETALPALGRRRHLYVFGLKDFGNLRVCGTTELIWDKGIVGLGDLSLPWGPAHERILFGCYEHSKANIAKGDGRLSARLRRGSVLRVQRINSVAVNRHPTEKPVKLLRMLIESSTLMDETVLDPFAGVGSTGVAALLEGRKAVLVEIEERYCEIAAKRMMQAPMIFAEQQPQPEQIPLGVGGDDNG